MGHILRTNRFPKHFMEGKIKKGRIKVMGRRERRNKQLLNDVNETRNWKLKEEATDRTLW